MGGGGGLPFGPHFGLRAPSLDLPLFYRGNTSSAFDKKKEKFPTIFLQFPRTVFSET